MTIYKWYVQRYEECHYVTKIHIARFSVGRMFVQSELKSSNLICKGWSSSSLDYWWSIMKNLTFWRWLTTVGCFGGSDVPGCWWRHIRYGWRRRRQSRISARGTTIVTVLDTHGQLSKAISIGHPAVWGKRKWSHRRPNVQYSFSVSWLSDIFSRTNWILNLDDSISRSWPKSSKI